MSPSLAVAAHEPFSRVSASPGVLPPRCSLGFTDPSSGSLLSMELS
jgi:hypothetical protein